MSSAAISSAAPLLEVNNLARSFANRRAVAGVSFSLEAGQCLAVFGPNGAGKTTLLRLLAGLLKPTSGSAALNGIIVAEPQARARAGIISHDTMLYDALSPRENAMFAARLYGVDDPRRTVDATLDRLSMLDRADTPVRSLSRGMQQRVSIARAMVHSPQLLLADEPYNGLDDAGARALTSLFHDLRSSGTALVIVTHNLGEGLALATHATVMNRGKFIRYEERPRIDASSYAESYRESIARD